MKKAIPSIIIGKENPYQDACRILGQTPMTEENFSIFPEKQRRYMHSMHRIVTVIDAQKQDRSFNWNDFSEYKYYPWWDMETYDDATAGSGFSYDDYGYYRTFTDVGARLSSFSKEETRFIAEVMFEDYRVIMKE